MLQINHFCMTYLRLTLTLCLLKFDIFALGEFGSSLDIPVLIKFLVLIACLPEFVLKGVEKLTVIC